MDSAKFRAKLVEKGINVESLASLMGIDRSTLYRKIDNFEKFTIGEILRIKKVLDLTNSEVCEIFLI